MNIFLVSRNRYEYVGRFRELAAAFHEIGKLHLITVGSRSSQIENHRIYQETKAGSTGFFGRIAHGVDQIRFTRASLEYAREIGKIDVLVVYHQLSLVAGLFLKMRFRPRCLVVDCPELYLVERGNNLFGAFFNALERYFARRADVVICANEERADIMLQRLSLKDRPVVFENLRELSYVDKQDREAAAEKLSPYLHGGELRIISTNGCSVFRTDDVLVRNLNKVRGNVRLFLVGNGSEKDRNEIQRIIDEKGLKNVTILGRLSQSELKYLISQCHVGIVNYPQCDLNNFYCASGKLYEFVYEGLPVVTTTNPPLKRLCDTYGIGVADDAFWDGINQVLSDYDGYRARVAAFAQTHTAVNNNERFIREISDRIGCQIIDG